MAVLEALNLSKQFGGLKAVNDVSLKLNANEVLGLIGPNGAGKTTLFNVLTGALQPTNGKVIFNGIEITDLPPNKRCKLGLARTFQITQLFPKLSLLENVMVGATFGAGVTSKRKSELKDTSLEILGKMGLLDLAEHNAEGLSIGNRKKLELARALATSPKVLLLDEVVGGLNSSEYFRIMEIVKEIKADGVAVIMIEHVMKAVMGVSDRVIVLQQGELIAEGTPKEITENELVIEAYLGRGNNSVKV